MKKASIKHTSLFFIVVAFAGSGFFALAEDSNENLFSDFDQDGLSNAEELMYGTDPYNPDTDGDGYSDYAEIKNGYDPLKPAPGDKLVPYQSASSTSTTTPQPTLNENNESVSSSVSSDNENNLTQEVTAKFSAILETSTPEEAAQSIDTIIEETIEQNQKDIVLPEIDESTINIKKQDYSKLTEEERTAKIKQDAEEYLAAISYIFLTNSPDPVQSEKDLNMYVEKTVADLTSAITQGDQKYIDELYIISGNILAQMQELEVPENLVPLHKQGLQLTAYTQSLKEIATIDQNDPIRSMINISQILSLYQIFEAYSLEAETTFAQLGVETSALFTQLP